MEEHGRFDYTPIIDRPPLRLPDDARIAMWVIPNIEHFHYDKPAISIVPLTAGLQPDVLNHSWRDYGNRVGIWRIMEVMEKHGVPGTVALNAEVCRHAPRIIEEGNRLGWEWMGHGMTNSIMHNDQPEDEERGMIAEVVDTIAEHAGAAPKGWLGPALTESHNILDLLAEAGVEYVADWVNDEQPYPMTVRSGSMWSIPYSIEINDLNAFMYQGRSPAEFGQIIKDQFDVLYAEGETSARVMSICIHPFSVGHPFRCKYLDEALGYIKGHDRVWWATGHEIVKWCREQSG